MRRAVVHVDVDPEGRLSAEDLARGVRELTTLGIPARRDRGVHELELVIDSENADGARHRAAAVCARAFGVPAAIRAVTFISRGTDEDALGVVAAFGVRADLARIEENGEEVAVFTIDAADRRRVPESRLHTALEAALNCEVRIRFG